MISTIKAFADICKKEPIALGRQMENNYRQIIFDCSGFSEPITDITLVHQRSQDTAPYIVASTTESPLVWTIDNTDTAYYGYGKGELRVSFASGLAKSASFQTVVIKSITAGTEIPEPLQSWYDAMIDYIDENAVTLDEVDQAIEDYLDEHPVQAPVQSVNSMTGDVVITAASLGALTSESDPVFGASAAAGITSTDITAWNGKYTKPASGIPATDLTSTVQSRLLKTGGSTGQVLAKVSGTNYDVAWTTVSGGGAVDSVNGQTGTVVLDASDVGALPSTYTAPVQSVDGKTGAVQIMPTGGTAGQVLTKTASGTAWQTVSGGGAVDSVNGQTGTVVLDADDVGALPDTTVIPTKTSDLTNDSGFITSADDVFWCTFGTTTSAEIEAAIAAGQLPCVLYNDYVYVLAFRNSATNHRFVCFYGGKEKSVACQSGTWIPNGDLTFLTTSYTPPVTSVNGQTGAVTLSIPTVPTNVSAFTNDAGYLTQHQSLTAYQTKAITDTGGYFTTDTVEGALQEIGAEIAGINTLIGTGVIS